VKRLAAIAVACVAMAGCGGESEGPRLTVSAASSLKAPFTEYGGSFEGADVRLSFAGSDQLAAQIRAGARPDVFASADESLPDELFAAGRVERPVRFAANRLVVAVPATGAKVTRFDDLAKRGIRVATGAASVPVGKYTNQVLSRIPLTRRDAFLNNLKSRDPDVSAVVAKVFQGVVDAAFVYITDIDAAGGRLRAVELPKALQPEIVYAAAVVRGTPHPDEATRFVRDLITGDGARALRRAGFEPPP
jgi:molybdate transport system substrate-binding protein